METIFRAFKKYCKKTKNKIETRNKLLKAKIIKNFYSVI